MDAGSSIYIYRMIRIIFIFCGVRGVMVIIVGNGHDDTSSSSG